MNGPSNGVPLYWRKHFHNQFQTDNFMFTDQNVLSAWHQEGRTLYSGFHGPFGGFYSAKNQSASIESENVYNLLSHLRQKIEKSGQNLELRMRLFPEIIFSNWAAGQFSNLTKIGFNVDFSDVAHYIMLDTNWRNAWRRNRSRDYKKSAERIYGLQIRSQDDILHLYNVITKNANHKNRRFSLSFEGFKQMSAVLSGEELNLWIYKSSITGDNVAAAVCQIVDHRVVYVFRWGHVYNYKDYGLESSPMTFVADQLCQEYSNRGFKVLYVGTSSNQGVIDENLTHFKESLGALQARIDTISLKFLH
jgi:hypothetical protein